MKPIKYVVILFWMLNFLLSIFQTVDILVALGRLPDGTIIRPMGLFAFLCMTSFLALFLSFYGAVLCSTLFPRQARINLFCVLILISGALPAVNSFCTLSAVIEIKNLQLAD